MEHQVEEVKVEDVQMVETVLESQSDNRPDIEEALEDKEETIEEPRDMEVSDDPLTESQLDESKETAEETSSEVAEAEKSTDSEQKFDSEAEQSLEQSSEQPTDKSMESVTSDTIPEVAKVLREFTWEDGGDEVFLAGSFNEWQEVKMTER